MKIIFCDSTINRNDLLEEIEKKYIFKPAVGRGDILEAIEDKDNIEEIIIVDGLFAQCPSITHKEILFAISKGIKVTGVASMGALRAAELSRFGMHGYGKVFHLYKEGLVESDDEVAISYVKRKNKVYKTIPLINIRQTVSYHGLDYEIFRKSKEIFYKDRTWEKLRKTLPEDHFSLLESNYIDQKKIDVLDYLYQKGCDKVDKPNGLLSYKSIYFSNQYERHRKSTLINLVRSYISRFNIMEFERGSIKGIYRKASDFIGLEERAASFIQEICENKLWGVKVNSNLILSFKKKLLSELGIKSKDELYTHIVDKAIKGSELNILFSVLYLVYRYCFYIEYSESPL